MKLLSNWGFTREGWRNGQRGEYWVLLQGLLLIGVVLLPTYRLPSVVIPSPGIYGLWGIAGAIALLAVILLGKGLLDLGQSLTPLPFPREDGQLVQTGVYGWVRHPIYSGVILGILSYAIAQQSLSHFLATAILLLFFNAKANREETWLLERYPDYINYQQRVKKLIPWIY